MTLPQFLAYAVIFGGLPINWIVVIRLIVLYRRTRIPVIRERGIAATAIALVVTLFAFVFVNNSFFDPNGAPFSAFTSMVITRIAILMLALPAIYWLRLYRRQAENGVQESALQRIEEKLDDTAKTIETINDTHEKVVDIHDALPKEQGD